ncbi:MAG: GNAT family N-acetyltransferase [Muribaculaceae bacterium]|nr:GNAT family N-acetyltransferase [Muribaculaceae bacterium]
MPEPLTIDCRYSLDADDGFISDFIMVENAVFGGYFTKNLFTHKFQNNIYGDSIIVVVYQADGKPVAARALWRNDIAGKPAYQPGDTCVLKEARGKGIFSDMTRKAVAMLPENAIVYNFPNQNSFPGYIKLGWTEKHQYHMVLLTNKAYSREHPGEIDSRYFDWWIKDHPAIRFIKRGKSHYAVVPHARKFCFLVIGKISPEDAKKIKPLHKFGLIFFKSSRRTWYNRAFATGHAVTTCSDLNYIPAWKIDAL